MHVLVPQKDPLAPHRRKLALTDHFHLCIYCAHKFPVFDRKIVCLWFSSVLHGTVLASKGSVYDGLGVVDTFLVKCMERDNMAEKTRGQGKRIRQKNRKKRHKPLSNMNTLIFDFFASNSLIIQQHLPSSPTFDDTSVSLYVLSTSLHASQQYPPA